MRAFHSIVMEELESIVHIHTDLPGKAEDIQTPTIPGFHVAVDSCSDIFQLRRAVCSLMYNNLFCKYHPRFGQVISDRLDLNNPIKIQTHNMFVSDLLHEKGYNVIRDYPADACGLHLYANKYVSAKGELRTIFYSFLEREQASSKDSVDRYVEQQLLAGRELAIRLDFFRLTPKSNKYINAVHLEAFCY